MPVIKVSSKGAEQVPFDNEIWKKSLRRVLIFGEPLSGKSTSLLTFPAPRKIVVAPGELGFSSLQEDEENQIWVFEPQPGTSPDVQLAWFKKTIDDIHLGKHGEFQTLAIDGIHYLAELILTNHGYPDGPLFSDNSYGKGSNLARRDFNNFVIPLIAGPLPYVVATCYSDKELIDPLTSKSVGIWPDLPGKSAKRAPGMFPITLHAKRMGTAREEFYWDLKLTEQVRGVGVHIPVKFRKDLPATVPADWRVLEPLLLGAAQPVEKKVFTNQPKVVDKTTTS